MLKQGTIDAELAVKECLSRQSQVANKQQQERLNDYVDNDQQQTINNDDNSLDQSSKQQTDEDSSVNSLNSLDSAFDNNDDYEIEQAPTAIVPTSLFDSIQSVTHIDEPVHKQQHEAEHASFAVQRH